jgi:aldehyde:ferredoxin oxidoreductase
MNSKNHKLPKGYMNNILYVDLSEKSYHSEPLDPEIAQLFFGGRGLGICFLFEHFKKLQQVDKYENAFAEVHPLSADNVIVLATSPATGTRMPTSGRIHMNFKSPLTGALGSTNAGGRWAVEFKKSGYDVLVVTGKSPQPVYLVISNAGVEFFDAGPLKSLSSIETRAAIKEKHSKKTHVLAIGAGGKNLSYFACVLSDRGKALGRGGGGAVFGSKNLCAMAVLPGRETPIDVVDEKNLRVKNKSGAAYQARLKLDMGKFTKKEEHFGILSSMGSLGILGMVDNFGQLVHNNMRDTDHHPDDIEKISGEALRNHAQNAKPGETRIEVKRGTCYNCPITCKRETRLIDGKGNLVEAGEGPEFESTALLGANLSIYDLAVITRANYLANHYGLDTISLGATIAAFFDLYDVVTEKAGKLDPLEEKFLEETETFILEYGTPGFGKPDLLIPLIHLIGKAEGIGKHLAKGSYRLCERYGHPELSMSVKKLELPAYDPRSSFSQALCYEMNNRGGCHLEGGYTAPHAYCAGYAEWPANRIEGTPLIAKNATLKNTTLDVICACAYGSFSLNLDEYAALISAVTGAEYNSGTLKTLATRVITLERVFNRLCGLTHDDDWLPDRFYAEAIRAKGSPAMCRREDFQKMHREYYESLGWDARGRPTEETLRELELSEKVSGFGFQVSDDRGQKSDDR